MLVVIPYAASHDPSYIFRISPPKLSGWIPITRIITQKISHILVGLFILQLGISSGK